MFIRKIKNEYWVWSSKKASLDCMPWYKSKSIREIQIKYLSKLRKLQFKKINLTLMAGPKANKKPHVIMKCKNIREWAIGLNNDNQ